MSALFGLTGLLGTIITLILIVVKIVKKQPKKKLFIAFLIFLVLFIIGLLIPSKPKEIPNEMNSTESPASTYTPVPTNTSIPTDTPAPTNTPIPTDTPVPTNTPIPTDTPMPTNTSIPTDIPLTFILFDGVTGDYGKEVVLNSGTEFEEHEITYYIPEGIYSVTNLNAKGAGQVSVYSGGPEYDGEWQSFISDENCAAPIVVMANETKELSIKEGQFIVLSDGTDNLQFVMK